MLLKLILHGGVSYDLFRLSTFNLIILSDQCDEVRSSGLDRDVFCIHVYPNSSGKVKGFMRNKKAILTKVTRKE